MKARMTNDGIDDNLKKDGLCHYFSRVSAIDPAIEMISKKISMTCHVYIVILIMISTMMPISLAAPKDQQASPSLSQPNRDDSLAILQPEVWESVLFEDFESDKINESLWMFETGLLGKNQEEQVNGEAQIYTDENARLENGKLVIEANKPEPGQKLWKSSRLITRDKFSMLDGLVEFRLSMNGNENSLDGVFPAAWMMPQNRTYGYWPNSGEIDVFEYQEGWWGNETTPVGLHTANRNGANSLQDLGPANSDALTEYHIYSVERCNSIEKCANQQQIIFRRDGVEVAKFTKPNSSSTWEDWPFEDEPFYLIVNLALQPNEGSRVTNQTDGAQLLIDWIRVSKYREKKSQGNGQKSDDRKFKRPVNPAEPTENPADNNPKKVESSTEYQESIVPGRINPNEP